MLRKIQSIVIVAMLAVSMSGLPANASTTAYIKAWGKFSTQTYSGEGDDVITIPKSIKTMIIEGNHTGSSNFIVWALDKVGDRNDLVFNEIGTFDGITAIGTRRWDSKTKFLEVQADGAWEIKLKSMEKAGKFSGSGSEQAVIKYTSGFKVWRIRHSGSRNFIVWQYCTNGKSDLVVNKIGNYSGRNKLMSGSCILVIDADGEWSITR